MVSGLTFKFLIYFWIDFCAWCKKRGPVSFFGMALSSFPNTFTEKTVFPPLYILLICQLIDCICTGLFWALDSIPLISVVPILCCFEIRKYDASSFVLFQDCFRFPLNGKEAKIYRKRKIPTERQIHRRIEDQLNKPVCRFKKRKQSCESNYKYNEQ